MHIVRNPAEVNEMFRGVHRNQEAYKSNNAVCAQERYDFEVRLTRSLDSLAVDNLKFYELAADSGEGASWAVDLCFRTLPSGVVSALKKFIESDYLLSLAAYNLTIDVHPIYFSLFSDIDSIYFGYDTEFLSNKEASWLLSYAVNKAESERLPSSLHLARELLYPGDLINLLERK